MAAMWREDDEEFKVGGVKEGFRSKPRFSYNEVKMLLEAVKRNRYILLKKFNQGVSAETKKQTWTEITNQINSLGENHRQVRQIMKKWADLKCDGKRRIVAMRGPNGSNLRKKRLGPVEKMVHKILVMSPRGDGESDLDLEEPEFSKRFRKGPTPTAAPYSYLSLTDSSHPVAGEFSFDMSPLSSPEKELGEPLHSSSDFDLADDGEHNMDFDENDDSIFSSFPSSLQPPTSTSLDPLPDDARLRVKPVYTYSRTSQNQNQTQNQNSTRLPPGPSSSLASTFSTFPLAPDGDAASSSGAPPPSQTLVTSSLPAPSSSSTSSAANGATSHPAPPSTSIPPPSPPHPPPPADAPTVTSPSSNSILPPSTSSISASQPSDPLPSGSSLRRSQAQLAQMASQSLQQQQASRMLLTSVSRSLETLAQSVQLLVESQQEFVQESLLLQRETVDILRDFSNTALNMLRDKSSSGQLVTHHLPQYHHHHHPSSRF
ncbi:wiskott-Aldrich syndrome protein homolog 1 [Melanotaenia boesemani]|uniref:wiskott-Aldrich syndrome protein homolog 1 n=1 Tax=Melanotaenia boesemani TaxID=1250792 RepID=UPI001C0563F6|nr:wiskott-Aldrich syndrome protein homolog 1 [Melanotaenia boesemani]